jgi:hypothetical protein
MPEPQVRIRVGGRLVAVVDGWFDDAAVAVEFDDHRARRPRSRTVAPAGGVEGARGGGGRIVITGLRPSRYARVACWHASYRAIRAGTPCPHAFRAPVP